MFGYFLLNFLGMVSLIVFLDDQGTNLDSFTLMYLIHGLVILEQVDFETWNCNQLADTIRDCI